MTPGAERNISCGVLMYVSQTFQRFSWDINACTSVWLFLPTYCGTDHFEGIMIAAEKTP
jgi:hypothetical protein